MVAKIETPQATLDHNRRLLDTAIKHADRKEAKAKATTSTAIHCKPKSVGSSANPKPLGRAARDPKYKAWLEKGHE